jgi:hypothetical protein
MLKHFFSIHLQHEYRVILVPPEFPNSTAQQSKETQQRGAYQQVENLAKFVWIIGAMAYLQV